MDPIFRRSSFFYVTALCTYLVLMGRYLLTRDFPVFEVIPLFLPVWLLSAMFASEHDERYAFLRTLPVSDERVARIKFRLILSAVTVNWAVMMAAAAFRLRDAVAGPSTFVYLTLVVAVALLLAACYQIGIWRFGFSVMSVAIGVSVAAGLVLVIVHLASLKYNDSWPAAQPAVRRRVARRLAVDFQRRHRHDCAGGLLAPGAARRAHQGVERGAPVKKRKSEVATCDAGKLRWNHGLQDPGCVPAPDRRGGPARRVRAGGRRGVLLRRRSERRALRVREDGHVAARTGRPDPHPAAARSGHSGHAARRPGRQPAAVHVSHRPGDRGLRLPRQRD